MGALRLELISIYLQHRSSTQRNFSFLLLFTSASDKQQEHKARCRLQALHPETVSMLSSLPVMEGDWLTKGLMSGDEA